jgi:hypothetical protein
LRVFDRGVALDRLRRFGAGGLVFVEGAVDDVVLALALGLIALALHQSDPGDFLFQSFDLLVGDAGHGRFPPKTCQDYYSVLFQPFKICFCQPLK